MTSLLANVTVLEHLTETTGAREIALLATHVGGRSSIRPAHSNIPGFGSHLPQHALRKSYIHLYTIYNAKVRPWQMII